MEKKDTMYYRASQTVSRIIDDEAVIVRLTDKTVFVLNETGTKIWKLVCEGCSAREIAETVSEAYGRPVEETRREVTEFFQTMRARKLLTDHAPRETAPVQLMEMKRRTSYRPPAIRLEEELSAVASACDSGHSLEPACRAVPATCTTLFE